MQVGTTFRVYLDVGLLFQERLLLEMITLIVEEFFSPRKFKDQPISS